MRAAPLLAALALAGCAAPGDAAPSSADALPQRIEKFGCVIALGIADGPLDDARRREYPSGYEPVVDEGSPLDPTGPQVGVTFGIYDCERGTVDGRAFGPSRVAVWAVSVRPPREHYSEEADFEHALTQLWSSDAIEAAALAAWAIGGRGDATLSTAGMGDVAVELDARASAGALTGSFVGTNGGGRVDIANGTERNFVVSRGAVVGIVDADLANGSAIGVQGGPIQFPVGPGRVVVTGHALYDVDAPGLSVYGRFATEADVPAIAWSYRAIARPEGPT